MEKQLAALRASATKAAAHPLLPSDAKDAIARLVGVIGELAQQIDWLRRDLANAVIAPSSSSSTPPPH